jgi:hypothetical protein
MKKQPKIPLSLAKPLGIHYTHLVKVNRGIRQLSMLKALKCIDLAAEKGIFISILSLRPEIEKVKPYICQECCHYKRQKRRQERKKLLRKFAKNPADQKG